MPFEIQSFNVKPEHQALWFSSVKSGYHYKNKRKKKKNGKLFSPNTGVQSDNYNEGKVRQRSYKGEYSQRPSNQFRLTTEVKRRGERYWIMKKGSMIGWGTQ